MTESSIINNAQSFNFAYDLVDAKAALCPEKIAIKWSNNLGVNLDISFDELRHHSDTSAWYFRKLGVKAGDKVIILLRNRFEFWLVFLAFQKIGASAIIVDEPDVLDSFQDQIKHCKPCLVVALSESPFVEIGEQLKAKNPSIKTLVSVGNPVPRGWHDYHRGKRFAKTFIRPESIGQVQGDVFFIRNKGLIVDQYPNPLLIQKHGIVNKLDSFLYKISHDQVFVETDKT